MTITTKFVRSPNVVAYWRRNEFILEEFVRRRRVVAAPIFAEILQEFVRPRSATSVSRSLRRYPSRSVRRAVGELHEWGFLVSARDRTPSIAKAWRSSFPAAYYHFATRDVPYSTDPLEEASRLGKRLVEERQPDRYKEYRGFARRSLPNDPGTGRAPLSAVLARRRTVREFAAGRIPFTGLAKLVRGTWGQTGQVDGGLLGPLILKTSPSAGARHPIECYLLAWNVAGMRPGLYHYNVRRASLEQLRSGDFRDTAVRFAAGQGWVRSAAFLCVMTAVADRVFWKYSTSDAYRLFFLDAGHLAQTFVLLATAEGFGSFTTAAMQESAIERFLGIDGVREFPVYLCGAGMLRDASVSSSRRAASS